MLKQGEDDAQVQMLNWENFVIQQEKMQKLREDIMDLSSGAEAKLNLVDSKNQSLRESV